MAARKPIRVDRIAQAYDLSRQRIYQLTKSLGVCYEFFLQPDRLFQVLAEERQASHLRRRLSDPQERQRILQQLTHP